MSNTSVMQSLPLVAAVLGNKYGVEVSIGGNEASTNGREIRLPSLPIDCDVTLLGMARGYIDHESAHVRETDFAAIKSARLTPLERHIMNSIEDWRVENKIAEAFPGCRVNFNWLIRYFFGSDYKDKGGTIASLLPDWVLLTVRAWDEASVAPARDQVEVLIDRHFPGLVARLKTVMQEVRTHCSSTVDSIAHAKKIVACIKNKGRAMTTNSTHCFRSQKHDQRITEAGPEGVVEAGKTTSEAKNDLIRLLSATEDELPKDLGQHLSRELEDSVKTCSKKSTLIKVAEVGTKPFTSFPTEDLPEIKRAETALKVRMLSLLQAHQVKNNRNGRRGRLDSNRLSRIWIGDPKIFRSSVKKEGLNTAVHILMDCSGSMRGKMQLTAKVCGALAKAFESSVGINVGVTAFPANTDKRGGSYPGVYPVVAHGERVHSLFSTSATGGTPMGEAIWWVLQRMVLLRESRKIVLIITDGYPESKESVYAAMKAGGELGIEFYGVGVEFRGITDLFSKNCCYVNKIAELSPAIFKLFKQKIIKTI